MTDQMIVAAIIFIVVGAVSTGFYFYFKGMFYDEDGKFIKDAEPW